MSFIAAALLALTAPAPFAPAATGQAAPSQQSYAGILAAADSCMAASSVTALDTQRLARDGWSEVPVDNADKAPHPFKLFRKDGSGAIMMVNFAGTSAEPGTPHCHVMIVRDRGSVDALRDALVRYLGGPFMPGDQGLGEGNRVMRVPGRPFLLVLRPLSDDKDFMAEIHIMPIGEDE
jgi:hypothetical protein